jgi:hypothetical protein
MCHWIGAMMACMSVLVYLLADYCFMQMSGGHGDMSNKIDKLLALFKDVQDRLDHLEGKQI